MIGDGKKGKRTKYGSALFFYKYMLYLSLMKTVTVNAFRNFLGFSCAILSLCLISKNAQAHTCPLFTTPTNSFYPYPTGLQGTGDSQWIYQEFQPDGVPETNTASAWKILVRERSVDKSRNTLAIEQAYYTTSEGQEIKVLIDLWPAQIWATYEDAAVPSVNANGDSNDTVLLDLRWGAKLSPVTGQQFGGECSTPGPVFPDPNLSGSGSESVFMMELRETGLNEINLHLGQSASLTSPERPSIWRRGQELVLWASSDAGNYDNVISYHFHDDGRVTAQVGTSGWNTNAPYFQRTGWTPHIHTVLWRVEPRIGDWQQNETVSIVRYIQTSHDETITVTHQTVEAEIIDEPTQYTSLLFEGPETNAHGLPWSYSLARMTGGSARHRVAQGGSKVNSDFYLLKRKPEEETLQFITASLIGGNGSSNIASAMDGESIANGGAVVFAVTSIKHVPRSEDFLVPPLGFYSSPPASSHYTQVYEPGAIMNRTELAWHGITLTPRNLYDYVPFAGNWTGWNSFDLPSGSGDYEIIQHHVNFGNACQFPIQVQCRLVSSGLDWSQTSQVYSCNPASGGVCVNANQPGNQLCSNYEARFLCP